MGYLIDQQPQLTKLISESEFLVDYDPTDCYLFFKNCVEDLHEILNVETQFFWLETRSFESLLETYFNLDKQVEWFNEVYYGFKELIEEYYDEIYDQSILIIQSGYSEGLIVLDGELWDSWSDEERDSFE